MKANVNPRAMRNIQKVFNEPGREYDSIEKKSYTEKCKEEEEKRKSELINHNNSQKRPVVCNENFLKNIQTPLPKSRSTTGSSEKIMYTGKDNINIHNKGLPPLYQCSMDLKNKAHFIYYGGNLYYYNGKCYDVLNEREVVGLYRKLIDNKVGGEKSMSTIMQLYKFLCTDPEICIEKVPNNLRIAVLENGIYCVESGELYPHSHKLITFSYLNASYVEGKKCKEFDRFIYDVTGGNEILITRLWMALGYLLMQTMEAKVFFIMGEAPDSGKSLLGNFVENLFPERYISNVALNDFNGQFSLAPLVGAALNVSLDLPASKLNDAAVSRLKMLTGGDAVNINQKYMPEFRYINRAKFLFASNTPIVISKDDDAFWRRVVYLPFEITIPKEKQNRRLLKDLLKEKNAIVSKALQYARELVENDFEFPTTPEIVSKMEECRGKINTGIEAFLQSCCRFDRNYKGELLDTLYKAYESYCMNYTYTPLSRIRFKSYLENQVGLKHCKMRCGGPNPQSAFKEICLSQGGLYNE